MKFHKKRRKQKAKETIFGKLPESVVAEIMSWLSPECLVHCKLVNKSWCSLIDTSWFLSKHLENFGSKSSPLLFLRDQFTSVDTDITCNELVTSYNYVCDGDDVNNDKEKIQFNNQSLAIMCIDRPSRVVKADYRTTHCNGIIFQTENNSNTIWLWNPTTRLEFRLLKNTCSCYSKSGFKTFASGLGYDAIDRVHKVVRVVTLSSCFRAEICTLDLDSKPCWREIRMVINIGDHLTTYTASDGVYYKGSLYWLLCHKKIASPHERMMISFDMHAEEFRIVSLPSDVVNKPMEFDSVSAVSVGEYRVTRVKMGLWFGVWNKRPTLLKYVNETIPLKAQGISRPVEMWTMNKQEEEKRGCCWVKHATFFPRVKRFEPKVFWKTDELLLGTCEKDHIVSYNLRTRKIRTVEISFQRLFSFSNAFSYSYVKSLVSFDY